MGAGHFYALHFLQFGQDYTGVPPHLRDPATGKEYVYIYATNRNKEPAAGVIHLFRTPKDKIDDDDAYEYHSRDSAGNLHWSADIADSVPVISDPGRGADARIVYNPGIKRYLLTYSWYQSSANIVILDAPEPWGP